ncbi:hypothetical protein GCM10022297_04330 [Lactobacillus hamsteri]|uniref:Tetratricopeptide repeat protein n=1 Tax=Lactobacillus hamsteri DSM 5661 = JCM 6256 TaxID=1423754 RepID=A0A0R1Y4T0_9LACO|nr:tetratricopeptide repeat protein [Lactobacillus hamsteri]KRM37183.1 hypothetical protein FC39_GL000291 [Lactobacillus hamsteri DSM 5661 = JCM 6256]
MISVSQKNLLKLAEENEQKGDIETAIQNLEEALRSGRSNEIMLYLCRLYRKNNQGDRAYTLIKEEPDLFSDQQVYKEYCEILAANHFFIEALQLERLSGKKIPIKVEAASVEKQNLIMDLFKRQKNVTQWDYEQLLKLDLVNFKNFAQSLLLDPSQNFAVRLSLCEDLIRLRVKENIKIIILGEEEKFVPADTLLLEQSPIYKEIISGIGSKFRNNPSQLPMMLGEINLILGGLYPKLSSYVDETDSFTSDLISFLNTGNGRRHQKLFKKIYTYLPK